MNSELPNRQGGLAYHIMLEPHPEAIRQWQCERKRWPAMRSSHQASEEWSQLPGLNRSDFQTGRAGQNDPKKNQFSARRSFCHPPVS